MSTPPLPSYASFGAPSVSSLKWEGNRLRCRQLKKFNEKPNKEGIVNSLLLQKDLNPPLYHYDLFQRCL